MSAAMQTIPIPSPIPGNGHKRPGRKAKAVAPSPFVPPIAPAPPVATIARPAAPANGTLAWLYARKTEREIELRVINQMISSFGPARVKTPGAPRKAKSKRSRRRAAAPPA
jgi:hypothetical protein